VYHIKQLLDEEIMSYTCNEQRTLTIILHWLYYIKQLLDEGIMSYNCNEQ